MLAAAAAGWARVESAAAARKQAVMAELFRRRTGLDEALDRELWWVDPDSAVAAELAAAQHISPAMALAQTHRAVALRDRLPKVAAMFEAGLISDLLVRTIVYRTSLMLDPDALTAIDADFCEVVQRWGALSASKTEQAIDALVERHDPAAVRRVRHSSRKRFADVGAPSDEPGYTSVYARIYATDAVAFEERLDELTYSVCPDDPRTRDERRGDALRAMATGAATLPCECDSTDCTATTTERPPRNTVIHVVAHAHTVADARQRRHRNDAESLAEDQDSVDDTGEPVDVSEPIAAERSERRAESDCAAAAIVLGGGVIDAETLAAFIDRASVRTITHPGDAPPEPRYRPSTALDDYIRARDLTCRFPGCDRPAHHTDIDHSVPYPYGPTCASNLACLCRAHHLLKTFWTGEKGWRVRQFPDATLIWTAPNGQTYTTHPGSALFFPDLARPTAPAILRQLPDKPCRDRGAMMPRRRRTRAQDRDYRIHRERQDNVNHPDYRDDHTRPPPF